MNVQNDRFFRKLKLIAIGSFCLGLGLFLVSKVLSSIATNDLRESHSQSTYSYQVLVQSNNLELQLQSVQNHSRGYILTGDPVFKNAHNRFAERANASFSGLSGFLLQKEGQDSAVQALGTSIDALTTHTKELIGWKDAGENGRIEKAVSSLKGKKLMDALMLQTSAIKEKEQDLLQHRLKQSRKMYTIIDQFTLASSILGSAFLLVAFLFIYSSLRKKEQQEKKEGDPIPYKDPVQTLPMQINYDRLTENSLGDLGFVREMLEGYLDHVPTLVNEMEQCQVPADEKELRSLAHKMRSASQVLEIAGLNSDLERIELFPDPEKNKEELRALKEKACSTFRAAFPLIEEKVRQMKM